VVIDAVERQGKYSITGLLDLHPPRGERLGIYPVLGAPSDLPSLMKRLNIEGCVVAIEDNRTRAETVADIRAAVENIPFVTVVHPSAETAGDVKFGAGVVVTAGAAINSGAIIGDHCIVNTHASVDHDTVVEEYASLAAGVTLGGNVRIGAHTVLQLGVKVIHGRTIGPHAVIGAGSTVVSDIPAYAAARGTPARVVEPRKTGED